MCGNIRKHRIINEVICRKVEVALIEANREDDLDGLDMYNVDRGMR